MTNDEYKSSPDEPAILDPQSSTFAWQPLTPRGVAVFATASLGRLGFVQLIVALLAATTVVWFLWSAWLPTVQEAIKHLPTHGDIHGRQLDWHGDTPALLAEGLFLSFVVDLNHSGEAGRVAQVQVELGTADFKICSLLGCVTLRYPQGWIVSLNRTEFEPWWGAWKPAITAMIFLTTVLVLIVTWWLMATLYCVPAWIIALYEDRDLSLQESWKLAAAAMLPGALLQTAAIFFYGLNLIDPVRFGMSTILHFVVGWFYLFVSPLCRPRRFAGLPGKANPFSGARPGTGTDGKSNQGR